MPALDSKPGPMPAILRESAAARQVFWPQVEDVYFAVEPMLAVTHWVKGCRCHEAELLAGQKVVHDFVKSGVGYTVNLRPDDGTPGVVPMDVNALGVNAMEDKQPFEGYCFGCNKWGHRRSYCRMAE